MEKTSPCVKCCFTFHNHSRVFNNEQNSYRKMGLECEIQINELYATITILTIHKQRLIDFSCLMPLSPIFQQYHGDQCQSWKKPDTQREPSTMGKQLVNFISCGCESSAPFFVIYKAWCEPTPFWRQACMSCQVIQLPNSLSHLSPTNKESYWQNDRPHLVHFFCYSVQHRP